jgi:hypothetical protein
MKPSNEIIEKFQRIYHEEFGEEVSREKAYEKFLRLVNLLRVILGLPTQKNQDTKNLDTFDSDLTKR